MLQNADSLGGTTIAIGMAGTISVVLLRIILPEQYNSRRVQCAAIIFGCFFSSASCISNFVNGLAGYKGLILLILAGMIIGYYLFYLLYYLCSKPSIYKDNLNISSNKKADKILFFISFLTIIFCDLFFYLTSNFPGTFSPDSYSSIIQSLSNEYSDHHPFWFTILVKMALTLGLDIFHSITAGYIIFFVVQICFLAFSFSVGILTLFQIGAPIYSVVALLLFTVIMPYNLVYSSTLWKDIPFGISILLVTVALLRNMISLNDNTSVWGGAFNRIILLIGLYGSFIYRNNGWYAMISVTILFIFFFRKTYKTVIFCMIGMFILTLVMKHPVERVLNVQPTEVHESLSIPIQQLGYVINYENDISDEEWVILDRFFVSRDIWSSYVCYISDPLKSQMIDAYASDHLSEFLRLWVKIGVRHPKGYMNAWINQTRGYWNGGYEYWRWGTANGNSNSRRMISTSIVYDLSEENRQVQPFARWFDSYFSHFQEYYFCHPFLSIGLFSWLMLALIMINFLLGRKIMGFVGFPCMFSVLTLLIASPVFSEFRYAYCLFTTVPTYLLISIYYNSSCKCTVAEPLT